MPTWLFKKYAELFIPFLTVLVSKSLQSGHFTASFKSAIITPILKKSNLDSSDVKNYCPVSNLSVLSKLLERIVFAQLISYLNKFSLLSRHQSAYRTFDIRKGHLSTETALANV